MSMQQHEQMGEFRIRAPQEGRPAESVKGLLRVFHPVNNFCLIDLILIERIGKTYFKFFERNPCEGSNEYMDIAAVAMM
jgi:hypothetical protein